MMPTTQGAAIRLLPPLSTAITLLLAAIFVFFAHCASVAMAELDVGGQELPRRRMTHAPSPRALCPAGACPSLSSGKIQDLHSGSLRPTFQWKSFCAFVDRSILIIASRGLRLINGSMQV
jgi:hypothetical protein